MKRRILIFVIAIWTVVVTVHAFGGEGTGNDYSFDSGIFVVGDYECFERMMRHSEHTPHIPAGSHEYQLFCRESGGLIFGLVMSLIYRVDNDTSRNDTPPPPVRTCPPEVLHKLEREKDGVCHSGWSCNKLEKSEITCEKLKHNYSEASLCLDLRERITRECFGNNWDAGHRKQWNDVKNGMENCRTKWIDHNCEGEIDGS